MISSAGHACDGGNRTLPWSKFCDGIIDCYDRSDEEGHFCKLCIDNLYSCPPEDDIRCDLACRTLNYVPCRTIRDRQACLKINNSDDYFSSFQLLKDWNFYLAVTIATVVILLILTGLVLLIKYVVRYYRQRQVRFLTKLRTQNRNLPSAPPPPPPYLSTPERIRLDGHIYEQCYDPPSYEAAQKYPLTQGYYEHVL